MIRSFGAISLSLAICPIGIYCAGPSAASPPGGDGQCSFVLEQPKVVSVSGVDYVLAGLHQGACTLNAHTEFTVCLTVEGGDSAGQCAFASEPHTARVYYPYRPGTTYVATGKGCMNTLQGSASPAAPATLCQDIPASHVTL